MSPTPTLIRQVAANGGISISVNGIARPLDEANCRLTRELVGRIGPHRSCVGETTPTPPRFASVKERDAAPQ